MAKRDKKSGAFKSDYVDDDLYRIVGLTAPVARPTHPEKMTMVEFDGDAGDVAAKNKLPNHPPSGRAIQMRLAKPWRQIVGEAIKAVQGNSVESLVGAAKKRAEWPELDEAHIYYAMRRVAAFLKVESLSELGYDAGRADLIASVAVAEAEILKEVLPVSSQIKRVAYDDWGTALALVGMKSERSQFQAHPMLNLVWHYYETKGAIPSETKLRAYANGELGLAMPRGRDRAFVEYVEELQAVRSERGWTTPEDGPAEGETLSPAELAGLLEGAPAWQEKGGWTEEKVEEAFVAYVREYLGKADLRLRHYQGVRSKHRWPSNQAYSKFLTFAQWVERAKQLIAAEDVAAAKKAA